MNYTPVFVTDGTLQALRVPPTIGRGFSRGDHEPGAAGTVLLSHGYWQRRFGGETSVVGQTLTIDSRPRTIIGVMPRGFQFPDQDRDLIVPVQLDRNRLFLGGFLYRALARLKPGVTVTQANADVERMIPTWLTAWPTPPGGDPAMFEQARIAPTLRPLKEDVVGDVGSALWVLMGTLGIVLLIACANAANLLLVRAEGRHHELAVRAALGAGWYRVARGLLVESLLLAVLGGVLGLGLAGVLLP